MLTTATQSLTCVLNFRNRFVFVYVTGVCDPKSAYFTPNPCSHRCNIFLHFFNRISKFRTGDLTFKLLCDRLALTQLAYSAEYEITNNTSDYFITGGLNEIICITYRPRTYFFHLDLPEFRRKTIIPFSGVRRNSQRTRALRWGAHPDRRGRHKYIHTYTFLTFLYVSSMGAPNPKGQGMPWMPCT